LSMPTQSQADRFRCPLSGVGSTRTDRREKMTTKTTIKRTQDRKWFAKVESGAHVNAPGYMETHEWFPLKAEAQTWAENEELRQAEAQRKMGMWRA
jgi:hypothetical protein